jgi:hypothetical protein
MAQNNAFLETVPLKLPYLSRFEPKYARFEPHSNAISLTKKADPRSVVWPVVFEVARYDSL